MSEGNIPTPAEFAIEVEKHFYGGTWEAFVKNAGGASHLKYLLEDTGTYVLLNDDVIRDINGRIFGRK